MCIFENLCGVISYYFHLKNVLCCSKNVFVTHLVMTGHIYRQLHLTYDNEFMAGMMY